MPLQKWGRTMNNATHSLRASLPNLISTSLPYLELPVDARYQFAVTYGAYAAEVFLLDDHPSLLCRHLPAALAYFMECSRSYPLNEGLPLADQPALSDAFVAGYLGRIQQELCKLKPYRPPASATPH